MNGPTIEFEEISVTSFFPFGETEDRSTKLALDARKLREECLKRRFEYFATPSGGDYGVLVGRSILASVKRTSNHKGDTFVTSVLAGPPRPLSDVKPFGVSYLLDMYDCRPGAADDLELNYRFLEQLVDVIGMTKQANPIVFHGPTKNGVELYPDKAGVSAWIPLIESGIQIHTIEPKKFISLDIYTCGEIDTRAAREFARETFGFTKCEERFLQRGVDYHVGS